MNTANLQMEGLLLALAALLDTIKRNGLLTQEQVEMALEQAESAAGVDAGHSADLSHAHAEAILFPIRFLKQVNDHGGADTAPYGDTTRAVGRDKPERLE